MLINFENRNTDVLANTTTLVFTGICGIVAGVPDGPFCGVNYTSYSVDAFCQDSICVACGEPGDPCCPGTSPNAALCCLQ